MRRDRILTALVLLLAAIAPPLASRWKSGLATHVLVQLPLLVAAGALLGAAGQQGPAQRHEPTTHGASTILLTFSCLAFWMLPRWIDAAVSDQRVDAAKIVSLVVLAGLPLGWGWIRIGAVIRAFVWANAASMLAALGLLYLGFPERLCSNYLVGEQVALGRTMILVAVFLVAAGLVRALTGPRRRSSSSSAKVSNTQVRSREELTSPQT
jgi:hypothetical protein